nr:hypothetical protein [Tanacetum cinerariifolium]
MIAIKAIFGSVYEATSTTLVVNKEFVPPLDMCRKIPWALSRINQIISDKEIRIKSTKRERVKIVKGLTSRRNSPWVGRGPGSDKETQTKCTCSTAGWHRLKIFIGFRFKPDNEELELFRNNELPHPPDKQRIAKSQCYTNLSASSGSNPTMFQDMLQQQYELDRAAKMKRLDRETSARVEIINSQKVAEDLKVLQIDTSEMDPVDAAIINAQKARIRALYQPQN